VSAQEQIASQFRRLVELRESRDQTKTAAESAEKEYRDYEAELFDELRDSPLEGTTRLDLGGNIGVVAFTPRETTFGRIIDAAAAVEYFEENGQTEEMLKPQIGKGKLNERVRELLEQGKKMPPGVDFYANRGITISRRG
jgi:hypothetical protein